MSALRKIDVEPPPRRRQSGIILGLPAALSERVRAKASERREHAQAMIAALIDYVFATGKADEMLDALGDGSRPGYGKVVAGDVVLTHNQAAVLLILGNNLDADGQCCLSTEKVGVLAGLRPSVAGSVLARLEKIEMVARATRGVKAGGRSGGLPRRLTKEGRRAWHDLNGGAP